MRVLLLTWACDRDDVSEPGVAYRWAKAIASEHDVTLFAVSKPARYGCVRAQFPDLNVIEWRDITLPKAMTRFQAVVKPGYISYFLRARRLIRSLLRTDGFDVIHHLSPFSFRFPSPAYGLGVPLIRGPVAGGLSIPRPMRSRFPMKNARTAIPFLDAARSRVDPIFRQSYQKTDHVLLAAPYVRELIPPLTTGCSIEIELGIDGITARTHREESSRLRLLYVGRVVRSKGLRDAIRGLALCDNAVLRVVGDGPDLLNCRREAEQLHISNRVEFLGWCSKERVQQEYQKADVFIFPSFREPTGGVVLEAMSHGLPSIICDYGGPPHIADRTCAILLRPSREDLYAEEVGRAINLMRDRKMREHLGLAAIDRAAANFCWKEKQVRISSLYKEVISRASGASGEAKV